MIFFVQTGYFINWFKLNPFQVPVGNGYMYFCLVNQSSAVGQAGVISCSLITELICVAVAFVTGIVKDWR